MTKDNNDWAFPQGGSRMGNEGMLLRDWFAGQALIGLAGLLSTEQVENLSDGVKGGLTEARAAYALADAMLLVRAK